MANVITRDDLAKRLQMWLERQTGDKPSMNAARDEVDWLFDTMGDALTNGDDVRIHGFGTFRTAERSARQGRNPKTGEAVQVPARRVVRFAPSGSLSTQLKNASK